MRFSAVALLSALAALAAAQNPFTRSEYDDIEAGFPEQITWDPTSEGTVTIVLVHGDPQNLERVEVLAGTSSSHSHTLNLRQETILTSHKAGIPNSGAYTWLPSTTLPRGDDYALQIIDDSDPTADPNYTPQFTIESDVEASESSSVTSVETETSTTETTETETETSTSTTEEPTTTETESSATETSETETETETETSTRSSSARTSAPAPSTSTEEAGAAPTGLKMGAGMVGFVGAAVLLL